jgi:hypothetical protein
MYIQFISHMLKTSISVTGSIERFKMLLSIKIDHRLLTRIILISVTIFYAVMLFPDLANLSPNLNDNVLQYNICVSMKGEIESGGNPIDHWLPYWSSGYAMLHNYQHLPHLMVVLTYFILFKQLSLLFIYHFYLYLLLVSFPLVLYFSLRAMRFPMLASAGAAIFSLTLTNIAGFGLEFHSFLFRGFGMYNQVWSTFLFPIAVSSIYLTLKDNKGYARSAFMLFLVTISQVMYGMMALIAAFLFLFASSDLSQIRERAKRFCAVILLFCVAIAYFLLPAKLDDKFVAPALYVQNEMMNSYGLRYVITHFLNGDILDLARLPMVTILSITGLLIALTRKRFIYKWAGSGLIISMLIFAGRPTWGRVIDLIPLGAMLQMHRFVFMVQFFALVLAGVGFHFLYEKFGRKMNGPILLALIFILIFPVYKERYVWLRENNDMLQKNKAAYLKEKTEFTSIIDTIKKAPPGRVYAGFRGSGNWGREFKIGQTAVLFLLAPEEIPSIGYFAHSWGLADDFGLNFNEWEKSHYDLFNIRYYLADKNRVAHPFLKEIKRTGRFRLYSVDTSGYFELVESPIAIYADKNSIWNITLLWMRTPMLGEKQHISFYFDRKPHSGYLDHKLFKDKTSYWDLTKGESDTVKITEPKRRPMNLFATKEPLGSERFANASPGRIISERPGKNIFIGKISADKDCFLMLKVSYHPCWNAYIDGKAAEKVILSPGYIGVRVTKGQHEVKFVYSPQKWKMPLFYSGLLILAALYLWERKRK